MGRMPIVHVSEDFSLNLSLVLRWLHFLVGITWVGLGYFFVLIGARWQKELDAGVRRQAAPALMDRALWWFRWSSVATVFIGLWLWMMEVGRIPGRRDKRAAR